ncbi:hypothetical protein GGI12_003810, partial [Dipsacomyces acuminosporus]
MNINNSSRESTTSEVDMDTSSDSEYDGPARNLTIDISGKHISPLARGSHIPEMSSRASTPQMPTWFSRSRAPSPPSALPRTPRATYASSPPSFLQSTPRVLDNRLFEPPMFDDDLRLHRRSTTPASTHKAAEIDSTLFTSDNSLLVVTLDSSDSDDSYDGDMEDPSANNWQDKARAILRRRTPREESKMLVEECRRLLNEESSANSRSNSKLDLSRLNARLHSDTKSPSQSSSSDTKETLLKTQVDLKEREREIAQLRQRISRKQTEVRLRKKLHESKLERSAGLAASMSVPGSPYERVDSPTASSNSELKPKTPEGPNGHAGQSSGKARGRSPAQNAASADSIGDPSSRQ